MRRVVTWLVVAVIVLVSAAGVGGYFLFTRPHVDELTRADAIVVLGGERDGRVEYGLKLAREGYADTLVLSDGYDGHYSALESTCSSSSAKLTVICFTPDPWTTRGEAMFTAELAREHGWTRVIVVSWNFHMVRSRYIFEKCFDGLLTMRPVPRTYDYSPSYWGYIYAYQYAALAKAVLQTC